jgi:hypothetical protein
VKSMFFTYAVPMNHALTILEACPGIQSLAFWDSDCFEPNLVDLQDYLQTLTESSPSPAILLFLNLLQLSLLGTFFSKDRHLSHSRDRQVTGSTSTELRKLDHFSMSLAMGSL